MAITEAELDAAQKKRSKLPFLFGLALALGLGAGGFYAVYSGMILAPSGTETDAPAQQSTTETAQLTFVAIDPMIVSLGSPGRGRHLRFRAELEVAAGGQADVAELMPRILDVLNGYLRAVPLEQLETPAALVLLRAQMLRRVQLVVGEGKVRDLLVTEFVLN